MFCAFSIGTKFFVVCEPGAQQMESLLKVIYELYTDYVLKNPFYEMEMPIRCELFDLNLSQAIQKDRVALLGRWIHSCLVRSTVSKTCSLCFVHQDIYFVTLHKVMYQFISSLRLQKLFLWIKIIPIPNFCHRYHRRLILSGVINLSKMVYIQNNRWLSNWSNPAKQNHLLIPMII